MSGLSFLAVPSGRAGAAVACRARSGHCSFRLVCCSRPSVPAQYVHTWGALRTQFRRRNESPVHARLPFRTTQRARGGDIAHSRARSPFVVSGEVRGCDVTRFWKLGSQGTCSSGTVSLSLPSERFRGFCVSSAAMSSVRVFILLWGSPQEKRWGMFRARESSPSVGAQRGIKRCAPVERCSHERGGR